MNENEIDKILNKIPDNMNIELNISCPNTEKKLINTNLSKFINPKRDWCIIKLSPISSHKFILLACKFEFNERSSSFLII